MPPLTARSAVDLGAAIRRRELTASDVMDAHLELLERTAPRLNAVVAERFERARAEARAIDQRISSASIRGEANTSELTLWLESDNPLYGRINNPYDVTRTAGGSSGGEGAAVASGGSAFGVAADIGGSIRVPALFCGVFGHKPSAGLIQNTGLWPSVSGEAQKLLGVGPLARRTEDLLPLLKIMSGPDGWDSGASDMELGDPATVSLDGLLVTLVEDSSLRPMSRDLRDARERSHPSGQPAELARRAAAVPGCPAGHRRRLAPLRTLLKHAGEPHTSLPALLWGGRRHTLPTRLTALAEALPLSGTIRARLLAQGKHLADELIDAIGDGVLLHRAQLSVAPPHQRTYGRPWITTPASVFNLAVVPVTETPLGLGTDGLPVGVQVAAAHGSDHLTIAIALELEAVFGGWVPPDL